MSGLPRKSRVNARLRGGLLVVILSLSSTHGMESALSQSQVPSQYPTSGQNNGRAPFGHEEDTNEDPMYRRAQHEAAKKRNIDRQKKLSEDSNRIAQLASELSTGVEPKAKNMTSAAMSKKAEEIEKLARSVRDLMKSE